MSKYLFKANYTLEGLKGVRAKGAKSRADAIASMVNGMSGTVESFYFAFGDDDAYVIAEVKDATDVAAVSLAVAAAGGARVTTVQLLTPDQMDAAAKKNVAYRAPGA